MIATINNEPNRFIYYNNGVTAVCEKFEYSPVGNNKKLICHKFQIINGAQTVTTLAKQDAQKLSEVKVLFKLIWGEKGNDINSPKGLNESVVKNTNSQTVISPSDFRSNDPIQISIEHAANKLDYKLTTPFKRIFYQRKRRKNSSKDSKIITMADLGKSYYSYMFNPYELNGNSQKLWDISASGFYNKVFEINGENDDIIDMDKLTDMLGAYYIFEYTKIKLKGMDKEKHPAVLFKYHIIWGIKIILEIKYSTEEIHNILKGIVNSGKFVNPKIDSESEKKFALIFDKVLRNINHCIKRIQSKESGVFVVRNYQRKKDFADEIKLQIQQIIPPNEIPELL
jgi:hypothetical protein